MALAKTEYGPAWAGKNLSEYGGTNDKEVLAEAFCLYTKPDYKAGELPQLLEGIVKSVLHAP